jgi:integrase
MRWQDVDLAKRMWTVPATVSKNGIASEVPLSPLALAILAEVPRLSGAEHVFPATNGSGRPASGFSKAKARLDRQLVETGATMTPWRLHDLRRSAASGMAQLGVAPQVLSHISGSIAGVAATYNRFGYGPEKRHALESWAAHLQHLIDPPAALSGRR